MEGSDPAPTSLIVQSPGDVTANPTSGSSTRCPVPHEDVSAPGLAVANSVSSEAAAVQEQELVNANAMARELEDPDPRGLGQPARTGAAAIAVNEPGGTIPLEAGAQPVDAPLRQAQQLGGLGHRQLTAENAGEHPDPSLFAVAHRDRLLHLRRLTKSLSSQRGQIH